MAQNIQLFKMVDKLPVEIISNVFNYLTVSDRKECSLVCKKWFEASQSAVLMHNVVITIHPSLIWTCQGNLKRLYRHVLINQIGDFSSVAWQNIWQHLCNSVITLSCHGSDITEKVFINLVHQLQQLEILDLSGCNSLFMSGTLLEFNSDLQLLRSGLSNVKELYLETVRYLSDALFNRLITVMPNIEKMSLAGCQITFHFQSYSEQHVISCVSGSLLTFGNILRFVHHQKNKLTSLNLSKTTLNNQTLKSLISITDLNLCELILCSCEDLTDDGILTLCLKQSHLEILDISLCCDITDQSLANICRYLPKLKILKGNKCRLFTNRGITNLSSLNNLIHLEFSSCHLVTSKGFSDGLCTDTHFLMKYLNLSYCSLIQDDFVFSMVIHFSKLTYLDLSSCFSITDISVHAISRYLLCLQYLRLSWCREISDNGLLGGNLSDNNHSINHVSLQQSHCRCTRHHQSIPSFPSAKARLTNGTVSDRAISPLKNPPSLSNLKYLQHLDLSACSKLTENSISLALRFVELHNLNLSMCPGLNDNGLISLGIHNPSLESLSINQCNGITDDGIISMLDYLPRLHSLNISNCEQLSNRTVEYLSMHCLHLRYLDVSFCSQITEASIEDLECKLKYLSVQKRCIGT